MSRRRAKPRTVNVPAAELVPIVSDAAIAGAIAEGANVPLLIFDADARPDLAEVVRVHEHLPPGDVEISWGVTDGDPDRVLLLLDFVRPITTRAAFAFSIERQGIVVDATLNAQAIYLQPGRPGDRLLDDPDRPKLLVQVPDGGFQAMWDGLFVEQTAAAFRRSGMDKAVAAAAARGFVEEIRQISGFRMPPG
jgi:hypothetical protein